jgi:sugar lactone lactonase YvrE
VTGWLAALLLAATAPTVAFTVSPRHRLVEGIATDGQTIWVSSVLDRAIIARRGNNTRTIELPVGVASPLGLAWDKQRQWLWIATDCPGLPGVTPCDSGALVAIDANGKLRASLKPAGALHAGDVSVGGGVVFVSDSQNGAVYRVEPSGQKLDLVVAPGVGKSAQGSALSPDGKWLIVADYSQGITRIDLTTGKRDLTLLGDKPLRGMDGLARAGDWYVGIQNGGSVGRLLAFRIIPEGLDVRVLAEGGGLADPTQLTVFKDTILVVADSGWAVADKPVEKPRIPAAILRYPWPWRNRGS